MHILLIHQAFVALGEPGGTRHHELARYLAQRGHRVTIIASPVSYLTGRVGEPGEPSGGDRWMSTSRSCGLTPIQHCTAALSTACSVS